MPSVWCFIRPVHAMSRLKWRRLLPESLPAFVSVVALFVDAEQALIREVLSRVRVDCLQFHGDEQAEACRLYDKPYIKAIRMQEGVNIGRMRKAICRCLRVVAGCLSSGPYRAAWAAVFDWDLIPSERALPIDSSWRIDAGNAMRAIEAVRPYALDVSSGVEAKKGVKDAEKMAAFIRTTNQATEIYD